MAKANYIAGLDIGSENTRFAFLERRGRDDFHVLGVSQAPTEGVRRGVVVRPEETALSIREAKEKLKKVTGIDARDAYVGIGDHRVTMYTSKGVVMVSRADGQITEEDLKRVILAAEDALPRLQNRQILYQFPKSYSVDGDAFIQSPIGMTGAKIEIEVVFVTAFLPHYKNLMEALDIAGIFPEDIVVSQIALSEILLSRKQKEIGVLLLNLGAQTTEACVWEEGTLLSLEVFPIGSAHITHDIGLGFRVGVDDAERLKRSYATVIEGGKKEIKFSGFNKELEIAFSPRRLREIVDARLGDIFELTQKHLKKIGRSGLLPAGVVITGGGALLPDVVDVAKKELYLPAELGHMSGFTSKKEPVDEPEWMTVLGLCYWGDEHEKGELRTFLGGVLPKKIKRFLRSLIP